eukprot:3941677-Rhodomonas_salina.1
MHAMYGCNAAIYGCSAAIYGCNDAIYGCSTAIYGCSAAMQGCGGPINGPFIGPFLPYAVCGTEAGDAESANGAMRSAVLSERMALREVRDVRSVWSYEECGTEIPYGAMRSA